MTEHQGGIEYFDGKTELFDVIIMNHVIEHLNDPIEVLEQCHALLKPGGQLWIETPNIDSFDYGRYKHNWRGLVAPRHLVLFNQRSLSEALKRTGFTALRNQTRKSACSSMARASYAMSRGLSPYAAVSVPMAMKLYSFITTLLEWIIPSQREFLTVTAGKVGK